MSEKDEEPVIDLYKADFHYWDRALSEEECFAFLHSEKPCDCLVCKPRGAQS